MALVLSCAFVACNKTDTTDAPKKEFTITFDTQGGSEVKPITIAEGATITLPNNPTKEGYVFAGWYLSNALVEEFNITKTITGNITLYAKWIEDSGIRRPSEGLEYSLNSDGNGYTVTGIGTCTDKELIIPSEYNAKPVTGIGNSAFSGCTWLTSVIIPDSVTSIGGSAFEDCTGLTSITIPDSVTSIGEESFYNCTGLTSVTIPDNVTRIGYSAFDGCIGLTSVTIGNGVTSIGNNAFDGCSEITSISGSSDVIIEVAKQASPKSFVGNITSGTSVMAGAFSGMTGLTSVTIGDSVTSIGPAAFGGCSSLESITIPFVGAKTGVTSSDTYQYPFGYIFGTSSYDGGVATTQYYYGNSTSSTTYETYYIPSSLKSVTVTGGNILYGAFSYCKGLTSVTIGSGVTNIGWGAFRGCTGLTSVTIPDSVTSIGYEAFFYCTRLTSVTIPDSVTSIGSSAFSGCTGLTSVTIPDRVTSIGNSVFSYCTGLTSITVAKGNTKYHSAENCLIGTESKTLIAGCKNSIIPTDGSVTSIGYMAFEGCTGLTSVTIPDRVTSIGFLAFANCTGLTSVTIPDSVTSIGYEAFLGCTGLTSITVAKGNTKYHSAGNCLIEKESKTLIAGCKNSIIPTDGSVTSIGDSAFSRRTGLTSITIPDSVTSIGDSAFSRCTGLTSITIPNSVTSIGSWAFEGCTGLTSITFNGTKAQWNAISKGGNWKYDVPSVCKVICTDGENSI